MSHRHLLKIEQQPNPFDYESRGHTVSSYRDSISNNLGLQLPVQFDIEAITCSQQSHHLSKEAELRLKTLIIKAFMAPENNSLAKVCQFIAGNSL